MKSKKLLVVSSLLVAGATLSPLFIVNSQKHENAKLPEKAFNFNFNDEGSIELAKNEFVLLDKFANKYNESDNLYKSFKNVIYLNYVSKMELDSDLVRNEIQEQIDKIKSSGKNFRLLSGKNIDNVSSALSQSFLDKTKKHAVVFNPNSPVQEVSFNENFLGTTGNFWERYEIFQEIGSSGYPHTYWKWIQKESTFKTATQSGKTKTFLIPNQDFIYQFESVHKRVDVIETTNNVEIGSVIKGDFSFDLENSGQNQFFVSFKNKKLPWDKFFVIKPSTIDDNGFAYHQTKPTIEFGFNLPLVNAIDWFAQVPQKFIELRNLIISFNTTWSGAYSYLFNEIFGSKTNFNRFMNNYLVNFANFYYDEAQYNLIIDFLRALNIQNPDTSIKQVAKDLLASKEVKWNGQTLPINKNNILASSNEIKSGSEYFRNVLKTNLNIDVPVLNTTDNSGIFNPVEFSNLDRINDYNSYSEVILPIILSQDIFVEYATSSNPKVSVKVYDGVKKQFNKNAIVAEPVSGDFANPYSKVTIKNISIGDIRTKEFLGTNTFVDTSEELSSFSLNSVLNRTKIENNKAYVSETGFDDPVAMNATNNGIEIEFRYLSTLRDIEDSSWYTYNNNQVEPFILIPDEAFDDIVDPNLTPESSLEDLLWSDSAQEIFNRTLARPFILDKNISSTTLIEAKKKYMNILENTTLTFTKSNISDYFLNYEFTNKYNEKSNKPWWSWTFSELVQEETNYNNGISGAFNIFQDNTRQDQWFKNFVSNPNLANKTMEDFFPKFDEGRVFVIGSYKPAIDSAQVKLDEKAGFYFAGNQYDAYNRITNINYVVELEVKNKTYNSQINNFNLSKNDFKNAELAYDSFKKLMEELVLDSRKYFRIDSSRFKEGQIQDARIEFVESNSDNPFIKNGYGHLLIDYQDTLPVVNQVGNEVSYEQLPLDLNKITGMTEFKNKYSKYIIESLDVYNGLSDIEKSNKILIDNVNNQIIIGAKVVALENNISLLDSNKIFFIGDEYIDSNIDKTFGFDQDSKNIVSFEEFKNKWNSYNQEELFDILFGRNNFNNHAEILRKTLLDNNIQLSVLISSDLKLFVQYKWNENGKEFISKSGALNVEELKAIRTDLVKQENFVFGYDREINNDISFTSFVLSLKNIETLANYFGLSEEEKINFISGVEKVEISDVDSVQHTFKISLSLKNGYVLYNATDSLVFDFKATELLEANIGNLDIDSINDEIKKQLISKSDEERIEYLNSLNLETKIQFFNENIRSLYAKDEIENIIFKMDGVNLVGDIIFRTNNLVLSANSNNVIENFDYQLKVDLGLIDPNATTKSIWLWVGIAVSSLLVVGIFVLMFLKRQKTKRQFYSSNKKTQPINAIWDEENKGLETSE